MDCHAPMKTFVLTGMKWDESMHLRDNTVYLWEQIKNEMDQSMHLRDSIVLPPF
jgi:hypothetical protein